MPFKAPCQQDQDALRTCDGIPAVSQPWVHTTNYEDTSFNFTFVAAALGACGFVLEGA